MGKRDRSKKNTEENLTGLLIILLLIAALGAFIAFNWVRNSVDLVLVGEEDMTVILGDSFEDPGTNIEGAEKVGEVDTETPGDYAISYTYGNKIVRRTVHVVGEDAFIMGLRGMQNMIVRQGDPFRDPGAFAVDRDLGTVEVSDVSGEVNTAEPGRYDLLYNFHASHVEKSILRTVEVIPQEKAENAEAVPVLRYRDLYREGKEPEDMSEGAVSLKEFRAQIKSLTEDGWYFPSMTELHYWTKGVISLPEKSVILTVDDQGKDALSRGARILEEYHVPCYCFIGGQKETDSKASDYASRYLIFSSRTYDLEKKKKGKPVIETKSVEKITEDLIMSIDLAGNSEALLYPYGEASKKAVKAAEEVGILAAFTGKEGPVLPDMDPLKLPRISVPKGMDGKKILDFLEEKKEEAGETDK